MISPRRGDKAAGDDILNRLKEMKENVDNTFKIGNGRSEGPVEDRGETRTDARSEVPAEEIKDPKRIQEFIEKNTGLASLIAPIREIFDNMMKPVSGSSKDLDRLIAMNKNESGKEIT